MKSHNENYEGKEVKIEVTSNGFLITNMTTFDSWKTYHANYMYELLNFLADKFGLIKVGERLDINSSENKNEKK